MRFFKATAAGFMIGLAAVGTMLVPAYKAVIFPAGLLMVVLSGSELFTGRMLLIADRSLHFPDILKWWAVIYIGNFIGSILISSMMASFLPAADISYKVSMSIPELLIRGILCNVLVCFAVWLAGKSDGIIDKAVVIYACISLFVLCGYEHSVANMTYLTIGMLQNTVTAIQFIRVLFFSTIGNIVGGIGVAFCISEERR